MLIPKSVSQSLMAMVCVVATLTFWPLDANAMPESGGADMNHSAAKLDDATCLSCHGAGHKKIEVPDEDDDMRPLLMIDQRKISRGVHGDLSCVECHTNIVDNEVPHKKTDAPNPDCVSCHVRVWADVRRKGLAEFKTRLGLVVQNIIAYKKSFHARPKSKTEPKAYCDDCHDTHYFNVPPVGTSKRTDWHLSVPEVCGKCHDDSLEEYENSAHGKEVMEKHNPRAAVCTDCHTSHAISKTRSDTFLLKVTQKCGSCHQDRYATYRDTYHGQINTLGYTYTAKCYDCHGYHEVLGVDDPDSTINPKNRLETCGECHNGRKLPKATKNFLNFGPHANSHDYKKYPQVWIAAKFMSGLLLFVFTYFWAHSLLWWLREYRHRKEHKSTRCIQTDELLQGEAMQVRRFGLVWRVGHLFFAMSVMLLILTGMALFYSYTSWAPVVVNMLGGPTIAGIIHRTCATLMLSIFFLHLILVSINIYLKRKTFRWFGPDSLLPNWKDFKDAWGMFKWFVGKGERPLFDRWTYWEKFDYWAVFWGMAVIGGSGVLLAFPGFTAALLPGWIFNVVMLVHGDEAFLAAVFLFTVHFFNNHFRPDKLPPPDVVMFTGTQSLEEFRRDHTLQYQRLVESGQLEKYLVDAPSTPMTLGSKILGLVLISCGLTLLVIVASGFFGGYSLDPSVLPQM